MITRSETAVQIRDVPIELVNGVYFVDGNLTVTFAWVDFGIGSYEAWGRRGFDSRMGAEDVEATDLEALMGLAFGDRDERVGLSPEEEARVKPGVLAKINELLSNDSRFADNVNEQIEAGA